MAESTESTSGSTTNVKPRKKRSDAGAQRLKALLAIAADGPVGITSASAEDLTALSGLGTSLIEDVKAERAARIKALGG